VRRHDARLRSALVGVDEQRHFAADLRQALHGGLDPRFLAGHVEAAFGGEFLTGFRHQADVRGADALGELHHFFGDGQKKIIIGDKGERIKRIGTEARKDMELLFDSKIMLNLWVKVKGGWSDDERALRSLGYGDL
jgi:hypothetical protein